MAGAASDVGYVRSGAEAIDGTVSEGKIGVDEEGIEPGAADAVHDVGELGPILGVGDAAALAKCARDLVHVLSQVRLEGRDGCKAHRPRGEHRGVFRGQ